MTGKGHLIIGTSTTLLLIHFFGENLSLGQGLGALVIGMIASLLPDIDTEHALLKDRILAGGKPKIVGSAKRHRSEIENVFVMLVGMCEVVLRLAVYVPLSIVSKVMRHRTYTHYLITPLIISLVMLPFLVVFKQPLIFILVFFLSYSTHLLGDAMTIAGVRLFYPFDKKSIRLLPRNHCIRMGEGSKSRWRYGVMTVKEQLVVVVFVVLVLGVFFLSG